MGCICPATELAGRSSRKCTHLPYDMDLHAGNVATSRTGVSGREVRAIQPIVLPALCLGAVSCCSCLFSLGCTCLMLKPDTATYNPNTFLLTEPDLFKGQARWSEYLNSQGLQTQRGAQSCCWPTQSQLCFQALEQITCILDWRLHLQAFNALPASVILQAI